MGAGLGSGLCQWFLITYCRTDARETHLWQGLMHCNALWRRHVSTHLRVHCNSDQLVLGIRRYAGSSKTGTSSGPANNLHGWTDTQLQRAFTGLEPGAYAALAMAFDAFCAASTRSAREELKRAQYDYWLKLANAPAYERCKRACEAASACIARTWRFINERLARPEGRLAAYKILFEEERKMEVEKEHLQRTRQRLIALQEETHSLTIMEVSQTRTLAEHAAKRARMEEDISKIEAL